MNWKYLFNRAWKYKTDVFYMIASYLLSHILPVKKNRIIMWSYYYTKYSCNPRYITEYLLKHYPLDYEIFWVFNDAEKIKNIDSRIVKIDKKSWRYLIVLNSAEIIITNTRMYWSSYFYKQKKQFYIQTWHSAMRLKKVESDAEYLDPFYIKQAKKDAQKCDLMISGSYYTSETIKRAFWYTGKILEIGTPRNDIFFRKDDCVRKKIQSFYKIDVDCKLVLYAPTFRTSLDTSVYDIDYEGVLDALIKKTNKKWKFLVRYHPNFLLDNLCCNAFYSDAVIDVTLYDDMQELLVASDCLITDYSSCMFDISLLRKPCFLFVTDYENYDRGTYFSLDNLPFPIAKSNEELLRNIETFIANDYQCAVERFNNYINYFETGEACKKLVEYMRYYRKNDN